MPNGYMMFCPHCKKGTFHTVKEDKVCTIFTCREDKDNPHRHVRWHLNARR